MGATNVDQQTVEGFGEEWSAYTQSELSDAERNDMFNAYFSIFPWDSLPSNAVGFDMGCGSGRWAQIVAGKVGHLHCIDASSNALAVARQNLANATNVTFHHASVDQFPIGDRSQDFGYSLGVLHHVPDTALAIRQCVAKLKAGAPLLLYLYYRFDDKPFYFKMIWRGSDIVRRGVSRLPFPLRKRIAAVIATLAYWPLAKMAKLGDRAGLNIENWPLSAYRSYSFYTMKTDALDRFGTRLEQRFTKAEITQMMERAGLRDIKFQEKVPYWVAVGITAT